MSANPYAAKVAAYSQVSAHGGVAAADPHRLILMLLDGALERVAGARGCIMRNDLTEKAQLVHRAVCILGELQASLDHSAGGLVARNLGELYDYMTRTLLAASARNNGQQMEEVSKLLREIRDAWAAMNPAAGARR
jgi:flagellar protein FliS